MNKAVGKIILTTVLFTMVSIFAAPIASADGVHGPTVPDIWRNRIKVFDSKAQIVSCIARGTPASNGRSVILQATAQNIEEKAWFALGPLVHVSYFTDPDDGMWRCTDETNNNLTGVIKSLGWSTRNDAFCGIGGKKTGFDNCLSNTANQTFGMEFPPRTEAQSVSDKIDAKLGWKPSITPELRYAANWEALRLSCSLKTGDGSGARIMRNLTSGELLDGSGSIDITNTVAVTVVNSDGTTNFVRFPIGKLQNKIISVARGDMLTSTTASEDDSGLMFGSCQAVADEMNSLSAQYLSSLSILSDDDKKESDPLGGGGTEDEARSTCNIEGIGWVVCPVMTWIAEINDAIFEFIANFLAIPPTIFGTDPTKALYGSWNAFRSLANIAFVIVFLIIIYSQITGAGITDYGVKKMLPKLIVAAILVNASYYVCQIAVDLSNLLGYGLNSLFTSMIDNFNGISGGTASNIAWYDVITNVLAGVVAGAALAAGVVALATAISVPVLLAGLLSLIMAALILIARQAIVVLLIAVSPIAFVLFLLPNTEKWFKKWWDLFFSMLMLFPIISVLFGAGALASNILGEMTFPEGSNMVEIVMQIAALAASVLPLIAIIPVLQGSLKATGALGAKLQGWSNKANSGIGSKVKTESRLGKMWSGGMANRAANRATKQQKSLSKGRYGALARIAGGKGYGNTLSDRAEEIENKEHNEAVTRATAGFVGKSDSEILGTARNSKATMAQRQAAIAHLLEKGDHNMKKEALNSVASLGTGSDSARARDSLATMYAKSDMSSLYGKGLAADIRTGSSFDLQSKLRENFGSITPGAISGNEKYAADVADAYRGADVTQKATIDKTLQSIASTPQLIGNMSEKGKSSIRSIGGQHANFGNTSPGSTSGSTDAPTGPSPSGSPSSGPSDGSGPSDSGGPSGNNLSVDQDPRYNGIWRRP